MSVSRVVFAGWIVAVLVVAEASAAPQVQGGLPSGTLAVQKYGGKERQALEFRSTILEQKDGQPPHVCMCRAMLYRVLQMAAQRRDGSVLKLDEIKSVRTGWPSEAYQEVLCEMLGLPRNRIQLTSEGPKCDQPVVDGAWWEVRFTDGRAFTCWATAQLLTDEFLKLRAEHKRGDKSPATKRSLQSVKERQVEKMCSVPLCQLFVVKP